MSEKYGVDRRQVLGLSAGLLGVGLFSPTVRAATAADVSGDVPNVSNITFYDLSQEGLKLGPTSVPDGETLRPVVAIGSGAFAASGGDQPSFYAVADSGPGIDCENAMDVTGRQPEHFCGDAGSGSIRPLPDFAPKIYRVTLDGEQRASLADKTTLTDSDGASLTTRTNPLSNGTTPMFSVEGDRIPFDPNGVDLEGVARTADGTFWLSGEYAPSLFKVDADGTVRRRYVPATIESDLSDATYPVSGALPEVFKRRDRGIESIGLGPDDSTVYFAFQSPLANPDPAAFEDSRNLRLGTFDPDEERVSAQYLYRLDRPETFQADADAGDVAQSDVKVSEISVVAQDRLLVLERISQTTKFYVVDLSDTAPIPERYDDPSTRPSLAQVDPSTESDVEPVPKQLLFTTDDYDGFPTKLEAIARPAPDELLILNDNDYGLFGDETSIARVRLDGPLGAAESGTATSTPSDTATPAPTSTSVAMQSDATATATPTETSGSGPGFGALTALSGAGLAAWRLLSDRDGDA